ATSPAITGHGADTRAGSVATGGDVRASRPEARATAGVPRLLGGDQELAAPLLMPCPLDTRGAAVEFGQTLLMRRRRLASRHPQYFSPAVGPGVPAERGRDVARPHRLKP